ncbi:hypothetical protein MP228_012603 [Amoeboaphelidium protococcarum]|nr:hypothetical protein MP228_012603 [Amoeboaphelidium protococcarum]
MTGFPIAFVSNNEAVAISQDVVSHLKVASLNSNSPMDQLIIERANAGYCLNPHSNIEILQSYGGGQSGGLVQVWNWIKNSQQLAAQQKCQFGSGIIAVLPSLLYHQSQSPQRQLQQQQQVIEEAQQQKKKHNRSSGGNFNATESSSAGNNNKKSQQQSSQHQRSHRASTAAMAYTAQINSQLSFTQITNSAMPDSIIIPSSQSLQSYQLSQQQQKQQQQQHRIQGLGITGGSEQQQHQLMGDHNQIVVVDGDGDISKADRELALLLISWDYGLDAMNQIDQMTAQGSQDSCLQAAAICFINGDISAAIDCVKAINGEGGDQTAILIAFSGIQQMQSFLQNNNHKAGTSNFQHQVKMLDLLRKLSDQIQQKWIRFILELVVNNGDLLKVLLSVEYNNGSESGLSMTEVLQIGLMALNGSQLGLLLQHCVQVSKALGLVEGLLVTGLVIRDGVEIIQKFLTRSDDLQSVALLLSLFNEDSFNAREEVTAQDVQTGLQFLQECIQNYQQFLNRLEMFNQRCRFDLERKRQYRRWSPNGGGSDSTQLQYGKSPGALSVGNKASPEMTVEKQVQAAFERLNSIQPQLYLKCHYCNQSITQESIFVPGIGVVGNKERSAATSSSGANLPLHKSFNAAVNTGAMSRLSSAGVGGGSGSDSLSNSSPWSFQYQQHNISGHPNLKPNACPNCRKSLPKCSICLLPMGLPLDTVLSGEDGISDDPVRYWFSWCPKCRHGGHAVHLSQWFKQHSVCPVGDCQCQCFAVGRQLES